jgi:preprotein translocase subunit SecY
VIDRARLRLALLGAAVVAVLCAVPPLLGLVGGGDEGAVEPAPLAPTAGEAGLGVATLLVAAVLLVVALYLLLLVSSWAGDVWARLRAGRPS